MNQALSVALISQSLILSFRFNIVSSHISLSNLLHKVVLVQYRQLLHLEDLLKKVYGDFTRLDGDEDFELFLFQEKLDADLSFF